MTGATRLLRQIHPSFVQAGRPTSQAFRPTDKDESELSGYDGDLITPQASYVHYTTVWKKVSIGAMALTVDECGAEGLPARPDPQADCKEHVVVDFNGVSDKECYRKSKKLQAKALARGWQHQAPAVPETR